MKNRAFTLIELLVVVLIIGVLTAIALPKYQVAVQKSRFATLMPAAKSVKNAEEAMLMANGSYSSKLADLDISLPGTPDDGDSKVTNSEGNSFTVNTDDNQSYVRALTKDEKNAYVMYFAKSSRYPGEIHCEALEGDDRAQQVCKSYGNTSTVTGTTSGYTAYVLEGTGTDAGAISTGAISVYDWQCYIDSEEGNCVAYDANGKQIATRDCYDFDSQGNCANYIGGEDATYDEHGNQLTYRTCVGSDSEGNCIQYSYGEDSTYSNNGDWTGYCWCKEWEGLTCTGEWNCDH